MWQKGEESAGDGRAIHHAPAPTTDLRCFHESESVSDALSLGNAFAVADYRSDDPNLTPPTCEPASVQS